MVRMTPGLVREKLANSGEKLVLMHDNADPDALGSAAALAAAYPGTSIGTYGGLSASARQMAEKLDIDIIDSPSTEKYETIVVVDSSTPSQLASPVVHADVVVIDHHADTGAWRDAGCRHVLIDESRVSCAEMVFEVLDGEITREQGVFLLCGILTDSGHFRFATADTLAAAAAIMKKCGVELPEIHGIVESERYFDVSKRIAMLKAAQRCAIEQVGKVVIATSVVGAFESQSGRALLYIGADVALIGSQNRKRFRISARARPHMVEMGIHLGTLLNRAASEMGAEGGGHDAAAGMKGEGDVEAMLHICKERLKEELLSDRTSKGYLNRGPDAA